MPGFERRGATLECDGHSLEDAALRFDTPLYVYSKAALVACYRDYESAFATRPHRICYAVKANASGALLRILAGLRAGADVVSGGELRAALRAGFPADRVVFSGVGKTDAEIHAGVAAGIGAFNAESEDEVRRISVAASAAGRTCRVALRVNPDIDARAHPFVSTGLRESKFGVGIARAPELLRRARRWPGIEIAGVQSHIGSQITDLAPLAESARGLAELSRRLLAEGFPLSTIDIGGGLGIDYEDAGVPGPAALAQALLPHLRDLPLTLLLEPGRSLVGRAGVLLTRVLQVKEAGARRFVVVDAGMNDLLRPALYAAYHRIEPVVLRERETWRVDVVGPVCETGDFLARGRILPRLAAGDLLAVADAGAYGFCMSSNYNLRPRAAEALVEEAGIRLVRRRESFEDLVAGEVE